MATTNATDVEQMLDELDPATVTAHDALHFRRIIAAREGVVRAKRELHDAVTAARTAGDSWLAIGTALGVSKQAAQKRFGSAGRESDPGSEDLAERGAVRE